MGWQTISKSGEATRRPTRPAHWFFLLQTLNEMQMQSQEQQTARLIVASLLSHCRDLLGSQIQTASRSRALFEAIRDYIDERYASTYPRICRTGVLYFAKLPSHLFQKNGAIGFNEYLNHTRLEHAKTLLKGYDLKVKKWRTPAALSTATTSAVCFVKYRTLAVGISSAVPQPTDRKPTTPE